MKFLLLSTAAVLGLVGQASACISVQITKLIDGYPGTKYSIIWLHNKEIIGSCCGDDCGHIKENGWDTNVYFEEVDGYTRAVVRATGGPDNIDTGTTSLGCYRYAEACEYSWSWFKEDGECTPGAPYRAEWCPGALGSGLT